MLFVLLYLSQYYLKTGTCKFGATCKYHHPRDKAGSTGRVQLNFLGLPLRPVGGSRPLSFLTYFSNILHCYVRMPTFDHPTVGASLSGARTKIRDIMCSPLPPPRYRD